MRKTGKHSNYVCSTLNRGTPKNVSEGTSEISLEEWIEVYRSVWNTGIFPVL